MYQNNVIFTEQHFPSNSHDFTRDEKFTIIEIKGSYMNATSIIKKRKETDKKYKNICAIRI